jgi:hypothetical protein
MGNDIMMQPWDAPKRTSDPATRFACLLSVAANVLDRLALSYASHAVAPHGGKMYETTIMCEISKGRDIESSSWIPAGIATKRAGTLRGLA